MGKPTGFMEYERKDKEALSVQERIKNFNEFHKEFDLETQKEQASRCMNCGVPFCQSPMKLEGKSVGCPLSNLIPEWNHLIYLGLYEEAYKRLSKVAPFPEFTGRVCPALCEASCNCSINGESVGVKANEMFLIEEAYKNGYIKPNVPSKRIGKKVAIIGSGPSGLACAKTLNDNGVNVEVFEKEDRIGGLLMYGIPNMKLEKNIVDRRINLFKEEGIVFHTSTHLGKDILLDDLQKQFDDVVLCLGTSKARMLNIENNDLEGVYLAVDFLKQTTKDLLNKEDFKYNCSGKKVIVLGGGDTANDCCGTAVREGATSVKELEITNEPPLKRTNEWPHYPNSKKTDYGVEECNEIYKEDIRNYNTTICELVGENGKLKGVYTKKVKQQFIDGRLSFIDIPDSKEYNECDMLLICMGFVGTLEEDLENNKLPSQNARITSIGGLIKNHLYVAGDARTGQSLVVSAAKDGIDIANLILKTYL